jgi:hypothetical protein
MPDSTLTNIAVISRALTKMGGVPIQSLQDPTREAQVASILYQSILDSETSDYPWSFAAAKIELNQTTTTPLDPRWQFQYQLPSDYLIIRDCFDQSGYNCAYEILGDFAYSSAPRLFAEYTQKQSERSLPEYFVDALVSRLAFEFTKSIVGFESDQDRAGKEWSQKESSARNRDAANNPPETLISPDASPLWRAHQGGY